MMSMFTRRKCPECGLWVEKSAQHDCNVEQPTEGFEAWGWNAAVRGETACPFTRGDGAYERWHRGYDKAEQAGLARLPRFRDVAGRRRCAE